MQKPMHSRWSPQPVSQGLGTVAAWGHYGHQPPFLDRDPEHAMDYPVVHNPCPTLTPCQKKGGGVEILKMLAIFPRSFGQRFCELLMSGAPGPVTGCCLLCVCVLSCLAGKADFSASYKAVLSSWFQILGPLEPLPQLGRSSNSAQKLQRLLWRPGVSSRGSLG